MRRLAHLDAAGALPAAGETGVELAADAEVAGHLGDPPREPLGRGARLPQVVDVGVEDVLDPDGAVRVVQRVQGGDELHRSAFFPRAISVCSASSRFCQRARYPSSHSSTSASGSGRRV